MKLHKPIMKINTGKVIRNSFVLLHSVRFFFLTTATIHNAAIMYDTFDHVLAGSLIKAHRVCSHHLTLGLPKYSAYVYQKQGAS